MNHCWSVQPDIKSNGGRDELGYSNPIWIRYAPLRCDVLLLCFINRDIQMLTQAARQIVM